MRTQKCPVCDGNGTIDSTSTKCKFCAGRGVVITEQSKLTFKTREVKHV